MISKGVTGITNSFHRAVFSLADQRADPASTIASMVMLPIIAITPQTPGPDSLKRIRISSDTG